MNITICHSHQQRCGIREYGTQLDRSFHALGHTLHQFSYSNLGDAMPTLQPGSIFLAHVEPNLATSWYLNQYLDAARDRGAKIVLCCHCYYEEYMRQFVGHYDAMVVHREYPQTCPQMVAIPLGCPTYAIIDSPDTIRRKHNLPIGKILLSTIGFLTRWKEIPALAQAMLDAVTESPQLHVHFHTPWPFSEYDARVEDPLIREIITQHKNTGQVTFSTEFLPEREVLDIAYASDLGFVYHGIHTNSVSAATKQFVSVRRPQVVTGSSHASDLQHGVVRSPATAPAGFARDVVKTATTAGLMAALQKDAEREYARINMTTVARQYVALFERLLRE